MPSSKIARRPTSHERPRTLSLLSDPNPLHTNQTPLPPVPIHLAANPHPSTAAVGRPKSTTSHTAQNRPRLTRWASSGRRACLPRRRRRRGRGCGRGRGRRLVVLVPVLQVVAARDRLHRRPKELVFPVVVHASRCAGVARAPRSLLPRQTCRRLRRRTRGTLTSTLRSTSIGPGCCLMRSKPICCCPAAAADISHMDAPRSTRCAPNPGGSQVCPKLGYPN